MNIEIEKNVPVPNDYNRLMAKIEKRIAEVMSTKFPFEKMEIGDSFSMGLIGKENRMILDAINKHIKNEIKLFKSKNSAFNFYHKVYDIAVRVWRVE